MSGLAAFTETFWKLCTFVGAAMFGIVALHLLLLALLWYVRVRYLGEEYRQLAKWTHNVWRLIGTIERRTERRIAQFAAHHEMLFLVFAQVMYRLLADASPEELQRWRAYTWALRDDGASAIGFALALVLHEDHAEIFDACEAHRAE